MTKIIKKECIVCYSALFFYYLAPGNINAFLSALKKLAKYLSTFVLFVRFPKI